MPVELDLPFHGVTYRTRDTLWDTYTAVRKAGIAWSPALGMWLLGGYEQIRAVLADPDTYSSANTLPPTETYPTEVREILSALPPRPTILINDVGKQHVRAKDLFNTGLVHRRVELLRPCMEQRINELIDDFGPTVDLRTVAHRYIATLVAALFGFPTEDAHTVQSWLANHQMVWNPVANTLLKMEAARGLVDFYRYLADLVADRRHNPRHDDLISDLLDVHPDGYRMPTEKVVWMLTVAPIAATDTARDTITSTVLALLDNGMWQEVRNYRPLLGPVIEETLRWLSPHCGLPRLVTREVELGGQHLAAGDQVLLLFGAANHDPEAFHRPEVFDPHRRHDGRFHSSGHHLTFGHGVHRCTGAALARTEVRVAVDTLLRRLPQPELLPLTTSPGGEPDWPFTPSPLFLGVAGLPMRTGDVGPSTLD